LWIQCPPINGQELLPSENEIIRISQEGQSLPPRKESAFNQQKENQGAIQQIYQPIPKRTKLDSPTLQAAHSEHSERSSGNRKTEQPSFLQLLKNSSSQLQNQMGEKSKLKLQS